MKIGKFVKQHLKQIFDYCEKVDVEELESLLDATYSKLTFGLNFPFCKEVEKIESSQSMRFWSEVYLIGNKRVRVTSQWFESSISAFIKYLESKGITPEFDSTENEPGIAGTITQLQAKVPSSRSNSRYRGNPIGNAQNLFIRNILSSLGLEAFSEEDWNSARKHFSNRCAYCGADVELVIEHAIPINKQKLGEHKLGNIIPSCRPCNSVKAGRDFREFLGENIDAIRKIEAYMQSRNYVPLGDNEQMKMILNLAHKEVSDLADRYITIINELLVPKPHAL